MLLHIIVTHYMGWVVQDDIQNALALSLQKLNQLRLTLPKVRVLYEGHAFTILPALKAVEQKKRHQGAHACLTELPLNYQWLLCNVLLFHNSIHNYQERKDEIKINGTELNCLKPVPHMWGKCIQFSSNTAQCEDIVLRRRYSKTERCTRQVKI